MAIPEAGQIVEVRQRPWVVVEVTATPFTPDPLRGLVHPQHLITLSSIEDDGLGEELQVLWELEPSRSIREQSGLPVPDGFDDPAQLDCFLDAVRWGSVSSADRKALQAPFRSGIEIEDYQLDPVVRALSMPRVNLLVADDVGLGKTIETGLVIQELLLRHRARSVLVICPSALQVQWQEQMRDKFGLPFRIIDSDLFKDLRRRRGLHVNPWAHFPRLIASIDFIKRERLFSSPGCLPHYPPAASPLPHRPAPQDDRRPGGRRIARPHRGLERGIRRRCGLRRAGTGPDRKRQRTLQPRRPR